MHPSGRIVGWLRLVGPQAAEAVPASRWRWPKLTRPKGNLSRRELRLLLVLGALPFLTMFLRLIALPGILSPGFDAPGIEALRQLGSTLNETFSLSSVSPNQRSHVLYLLLVPTYALLIVIARLTFGIRVLGVRSILIAVGFHQVGILPSLLLIGIVVATIALVRPWLKRVRLPYYARISVILSIVVMTMVGALIAGPWMRSDLLWGVAYFPVIVLGMLAEGIVNTLNRDSLLSASWRAATTIALALLMVLLAKVPSVLATVLQFPELLLTQLVAIVLIAEFMDFRLFQDWDSKMAGMALPKLFAQQDAYRVAVVRNQLDSGVIGRLGRPAPRKLAQKSVQRVVDALREGGHTVKVLEGDMTLLGELRQFMPSHPLTGQPGGIVFNLAHGIQGHGRYTHVPAMLEMAGVAYTGPTPLGHAAIFDRKVAKTLIQQAGVPTPAYCLMVRSKDDTTGLYYPLIVKPRHEPRYGYFIARDESQLGDLVKKVKSKYRQEVLVEEYIDGRQINVGLIGNDPVECLPLVEIERGTRKKLCPARIDEPLAKRIREYAKLAYWACGCRDYARIDFIVTDSGQPYVIEVHVVGILDQGGAFARAGAQAGYTYSQLLCRVVDVGRARYLAGDVVRPHGIGPNSDAPKHARRLRKFFRFVEN